jgi:Ger(x)C family germination protein
MKNRLLHVLFIFLLVTMVPGCNDRLDMEDAKMVLLLGFDLDKNNQMLVYVSSPVFDRNAKKKTQEIVVRADTPRESREASDAFSSGIYQARKLKVILVSKRLMQQKDWYRLMDVYFRDAKNPLTQRVIEYNGNLSEIFNLNPEDQPILPLLLAGMVDSESIRSETVKTTLQELNRQMVDKGMTPAVSEIRYKEAITMYGTALLDHKGLYRISLNSRESVLLQIMQNHVEKDVSLTIPIPGEPKGGPVYTDRLSLSSGRTKTKVNCSYRNGKFNFDLKIKMPVTLTELLFPYDVRQKGKELEKLIAGQVQHQFESLIRKIQKNKIDPIGLGLYARAYQYDHYKKVEDQWGEALSEAEIHVTVKVSVQSMGPVK